MADINSPCPPGQGWFSVYPGSGYSGPTVTGTNGQPGVCIPLTANPPGVQGNPASPAPRVPIVPAPRPGPPIAIPPRPPVGPSPNPNPPPVPGSCPPGQHWDPNGGLGGLGGGCVPDGPGGGPPTPGPGGGPPTPGPGGGPPTPGPGGGPPTPGPGGGNLPPSGNYPGLAPGALPYQAPTYPLWVYTGNVNEDVHSLPIGGNAGYGPPPTDWMKVWSLAGGPGGAGPAATTPNPPSTTPPPTTGDCPTGMVKNTQGICVPLEPCPTGQYRGPDGNCIDIGTGPPATPTPGNPVPPPGGGGPHLASATALPPATTVSDLGGILSGISAGGGGGFGVSPSFDELMKSIMGQGG